MTPTSSQPACWPPHTLCRGPAARSPEAWAAGMAGRPPRAHSPALKPAPGSGSPDLPQRLLLRLPAGLALWASHLCSHPGRAAAPRGCTGCGALSRQIPAQPQAGGSKSPWSLHGKCHLTVISSASVSVILPDQGTKAMCACGSYSRA